MLINIEKPFIHTILTIGIALVWLVNGLFCKLLNFVPRHQMIVSSLLGEDYSGVATKTIGVLEILMVIWILSRIKPRWCALTQIFVVAIMNTIEFLLVPELLLFGHANAIVATLFIVVIILNEFVFNNANAKKLNKEV